MIRVAVALLGLAFCLLAVAAGAAPASKDIPAVLKPWIPWVLRGHEEKTKCPAVHDNAEQRLCAWPSRLKLELTEKGGRFTQSWRVYNEGWVALPGGPRHWPAKVRVDRRAATVIDRNGVPSVRLKPGVRKVQGSFTWTGLPKSLPLSPRTGLVELSLDGKAEPFPRFDGRGQLWLSDGRAAAPAAENRLALRVFRRVDDDQPMRVTTLIRLDVAGGAREAALGPALPDGAIPLALDAKLPARLEAGGLLRVQLRPGTHEITLVARLPGPVDRLARPAAPAPWPAQEVWAFAARNDLRLVEVTGLPTIDPRQTTLPAGWRKLPAYRLDRGAAMTIVTKRRGDPKLAPNRLRLKRTIWLDFDGGGYSLHDEIQGSMRAGWRLDMDPPFDLGRVAVDGRDRFITRGQGSGKAGVELRRGLVQLTADSRFEGAGRRLDAVGWDHDFQLVSAELRLPPGWRLFHAGGADAVGTSWLGQWTMWSLFHVLIVALAVARLWRWYWGAAALATMVLTYHEAAGIAWALLAVLAAVGLFRAVPAGRLRGFVGLCRNSALLLLILLALPFVVEQVRMALYPQLERQARAVRSPGIMEGLLGGFSRESPALATMREEVTAAEKKRRRAGPLATMKVEEKEAPAESRQVQLQYDPNARVTTGPGLPSWKWSRVRLSWAGPVARGQTIELFLIPPWATGIARAAGALLAGLLTVLMLSSAVKFRLPRRAAPAAAGLTALLAAGITVTAPGPARAELPDAATLDQLRDRLLATPDCFPHCAQIPTLALKIDDQWMTARVSVETAEAVAVPLPGGDHRLWRLRRVDLDGKPASALRRDGSATLWIRVPKGRHVVRMAGPLANEAALALPLPLRPHRVTVEAEGWQVDGLGENGVPQAQISLSRPAAPGAQLDKLEPTRLPPFVRVERTLMLGLDWRVETRVVRDPATRGAVVVNLPLLDGESVTSADVRVRGGRVLVNMMPNQRDIRWTSTLERPGVLTITAPETTEWSELWRLDAGPTWRVASAGLAPVFREKRLGVWRPEWRPWPGETLTLTVIRPAGVDGRTLTIDGSRLVVRPGERGTTFQLGVDLRSSQGGQHVLRLPSAERIDEVAIDHRAVPARLRDGRLTVPVTPGTQTVTVKWQEQRLIGWMLETPAVDLGGPSVNSEISIMLPPDRWVLFALGPRLGPAVLFWGVLAVVVVLSIGLGRIKLTPLRFHHWLLLGIGLTQAPVAVAVIVVGWLLVLGGRPRLLAEAGPWTFNLAQIALGLLTLIALGGLFFAVQKGLLGQPEMQVAGNGSSASRLHWYQDRVDTLPPSARVLSVSIWFYKGLMLAWALWLAFALLGWLRWGWGRYAEGGLWRSGGGKSRRRPPPGPVPPQTPPKTAPKTPPTAPPAAPVPAGAD